MSCQNASVGINLSSAQVIPRQFLNRADECYQNDIAQNFLLMIYID
jgi:hypothetical protein